MNNHYRYLAAASLLLFIVAFVFFVIGLRTEAPGMIGIAFLVVSLTLLVGFVGNLKLSSHPAAKLTDEDSVQLAKGANSESADSSEFIVSIVFGGVTFLFFAAGIWFMTFGGSDLFA